MFVSEIGLDSSNWDYEDLEVRKGSLNGMSVSILGQNASFKELPLMINQTGTMLEKRKIDIASFNAVIREVDIGYKHTNSDGSSDEIDVKIGFGSNDGDRASNDDNDTRASDNDNDEG